MTGTLFVSLRANNGDIVFVNKKKFEIYEDEWDMLEELHRSYGCLAWNKHSSQSWIFTANVVQTDGNCEYFIAEFKPNNQ